MRAPICVACQLQMSCSRTGVDIELMAAEAGYQVWSGDLWKCEGCGLAVVRGFGNMPVTEHFKPHYAEIAAQAFLRFWCSPIDKGRA